MIRESHVYPDVYQGLTFDQVRAAFQDAVPRRRDEFARMVRARHLKIAHEHNYVQNFPTEVLRMAEAEIRARIEIAAERIKQLLRSGWRPENSTGVRSAFLDMFARFDDWQKDPQSDLYAAVEAAFESVGVHAPDKSVENVRRLGAVQVQAANEWMSDLDVFAATFLNSGLAADASAPSTIASLTGPWKYDVFISYASEHKAFVGELAEQLSARGLNVWLDRFVLTVADSLTEQITDGLKSSRYAVVVLSPAYFRKPWPRMELEGLIVRQNQNGQKVILPVWNQMDAADVAQENPVLAGRIAARSADGVQQVVGDLLEAMLRGS